MGTSAKVKIKSNGKTFPASLYVHFDGYPEHMLPWLENFQSEFKRTNDPSYKLAQLIRSTALMQEDYYLDGSTETGYGIDVDGSFETSVDYIYILHDDGTITVT